MELQEVRDYKQRLEKEYQELLVRKKELSEQLEIEEQIVSKIPNKDRTIIEQQIRIRGLEHKKVQTRQEINLEEINAYKQRVKKEYEDLLSSRQDLIKQIEENEKELLAIQENKSEIFRQIKEKDREAKEKLSLVETEKRIISAKAKEIEIKESGFLLIVKNQEKEKRNIQFSQEKLKQEAENLGKEKIGFEKEKNQFENSFIILSKVKEKAISQLKEIEKTKGFIEKKNQEQKKILKSILTREFKLKQRLEAVKKKEDYLEQEKETIRKDREHLYSQQSQLKNAFEEARNKGFL